MGISHAQELPKISDTFCFDLADSQGLLKKVKEYPILLNEISARDNKIVNLEETIKLKDQLLVIEVERQKLYQEKVDFYSKMVDEQKKLTDQYSAMNDRLEKKIERKQFWSTIQSIAMGVAGIFVGLAF